MDMFFSIMEYLQNIILMTAEIKVFDISLYNLFIGLFLTNALISLVFRIWKTNYKIEIKRGS